MLHLHKNVDFVPLNAGLNSISVLNNSDCLVVCSETEKSALNLNLKSSELYKLKHILHSTLISTDRNSLVPKYGLIVIVGWCVGAGCS